jgi:hypothetical protein
LRVSPTTSTNTFGFAARRGGGALRIGADHGLRRVDGLGVAHRVPPKRVDEVARRHQIAQLALVAHQRREVARHRQHGSDGHDQRDDQRCQP